MLSRYLPRIIMPVRVADKKKLIPTYFPCVSVDISNPRVGLVDITSCPFSRLRIVVLPALSKPLVTSLHGIKNPSARDSSQEKDSHFALFSFIFANNCQKAHCDC